MGLGEGKGGVSPEKKKLPLLEGGSWEKTLMGGVMQLSNDTSKHSSSPPYLAKMNGPLFHDDLSFTLHDNCSGEEKATHKFVNVLR